MRYSLSLFLVSFFSSSPFFLPFSFPFKFAEIAYWKPENWTGTLAIFHTCRAISPPFPPSPRSVAVRTIIAAWIIAESNNKRPWSPPLPTGLLRDLTFVQRNGRDYELFTPPSLPPSLLSKLGARFENGRGGGVHDPSPSKFVEIFHSLMGKKKLWKNFV